MKYLKLIRTFVVGFGSLITFVLAIAALIMLYSDVVMANISFSDKTSQSVSSSTNPVNQVGTGSIIYKYKDKTKFTQSALDTMVDMNITGVTNRVRVEQTFTNPSNDWVEGVYVFPLPEDSAIDHLTLFVDGRIIDGQIKERKEAKKIYNKAKNEGKKAAIIEQQRPNIFTTSVANIPPGGTIKIAIEYQQAVLIRDESFSIRFPMTIGDRYIPGVPISTPYDSMGVIPNTHTVKDASKITPPTSKHVDRPLSININLKAGFDLESIESSYHAIQVDEINNLTKRIKLTNDTTQADRDFVLNWRANKGLQPDVAIFTQQKGEDNYLMLMATPPKLEAFKKSNTPREVVFIIDSSGSMGGGSMTQAKSALHRAIQRLKPTDRFNIIDFDSKFDPLFYNPMPAIYMNIKRGAWFVNNLDADGGTMALGAIKYALESRDIRSNDYLRQIIFITDGHVGNEQDLFRVVRESMHDDRIFTIGIGSAPNSYLMTKMADLGKGTFTYIGSNSEVEDKMLKLFDKLESPALTNIDIQFPEGVEAEQALGSLGDLYAGETISAVFKLNVLPSSLDVSGNSVDGVYAKKIDIGINNNTTGIDVLWGRRKVEQLMDKYHSNMRLVDRDQTKLEITNLALNYHLVSKFTSLVAVDVTNSRSQEDPLIMKAVTKKKKALLLKKSMSATDRPLLEEAKLASMVKMSISAPKTATNSTFWLILGLLIMIIAYISSFRAKSA
ncbi:MAG: marine proteobacterial sortase target protein [Candidatus Thioglobus sp.]|jgi:Ca-activated chloride channel family protein